MFQVNGPLIHPKKGSKSGATMSAEEAKAIRFGKSGERRRRLERNGHIADTRLGLPSRVQRFLQSSIDLSSQISFKAHSEGPRRCCITWKGLGLAFEAGGLIVAKGELPN